MAASDPTPVTAAEFAALLAPFGLTAGARVAVGVSGGADSMALMCLAAEAGLDVTALTVDHGLRAEAADEARQVAAWAAARGVPHAILAHDGPKPAANLQAAARAIRYRLLAGWCRAAGLDALLIAHTQDDQAETVLLRLARGSGVDGLAAMAPDTRREGVRVLRPLLDVPRARLEATLRARGQAWLDDPSNLDPRHARVRLRALAPALAGEGLDAPRLAATARTMARARSALETWTQAHLAATVRLHASGVAVADAARLRDAPEEIVLRALSRLVVAIGGHDVPPRLAQVERLAARLGEDGFRGATLGGVSVAPRAQGLVFLREPRAARAAAAVTLAAEGPVLWDGRFELAPRRKAAGATVRALGPEGWRAVRGEAPDALRRLPAAAAAGLPALFAGGRLVEVPHVHGDRKSVV